MPQHRVLKAGKQNGNEGIFFHANHLRFFTPTMKAGTNLDQETFS